MDDPHNGTEQFGTTAIPPTASTVVLDQTNRVSNAGVTGAPSGVSQFKPGELIDGRFVVVRFIARGGMGEVYEVEDCQLRGAHVALKTILSQYAVDPVMRQRCEREVLCAREVVHPNLCPIYDLGYWNRPGGALTYLTMKLLPGESLAARISRAGPIPGKEALCIMRQVGGGIAAAHDAGILHRDIKSANIIVQGKGGQVIAWVTDFGLARAALGDRHFDVVVQWIGFVPEHIDADLELFRGRTHQYIFISSASAYQTPPARLPITESTPLHNPYWQY